MKTFLEQRKLLILASTSRISDMRGVVKSYAYGLQQLILKGVGVLPSHRVRAFLYARLGLDLGDFAVIYSGCEIRCPKKVQIGRYSSVGTRVTIDGRGEVSIGDCVNISSEAMLWTAQHDYNDPLFSAELGRIVIGNHVWIGPRVIILPGVEVAEGCVIAAGAVVTKSTTRCGVYAGIPAKRIGERRDEFMYKPSENYVHFI